MNNTDAYLAILDVYEGSKKKLDAFTKKSGEGNPKVKVQQQLLAKLENAAYYVKNKEWALDNIRRRITSVLQPLDEVILETSGVPEKLSKEQISALNQFISEMRGIEMETQEIIVNEKF